MGIASDSLARKLLVSALTLVLLGLVFLYAASAMRAVQQHSESFFYLEKQLYATLLGLVLAVFCVKIPFSWLEHATLPLLLISLFSLALIVVPGIYRFAGGAARWLQVGGYGFQAAEFSKLAVIFFLARLLSRPNFSWRSSMLPLIAVLSLFIGMIMLQPDFGTAALLLGLSLAMLYVGGLPHKYFFMASSGVGAALLAAAVFSPYRLRRLLAFLNPWEERQAAGFQILQSYVGFQNGGLWGAGLGASRQKLFFLPEAHTDFIFPVIAEEFGLLGSLLIVFLYLSIIFYGLQIAIQHLDLYKKFLAYGCTLLIALQSLFNLGVNTGLLPTKGIPLPFISSGSNSTLIFCCVLALLYRLGLELKVSHE